MGMMPAAAETVCSRSQRHRAGTRPAPTEGLRGMGNPSERRSEGRHKACPYMRVEGIGESVRLAERVQVQGQLLRRFDGTGRRWFGETLSIGHQLPISIPLSRGRLLGGGVARAETLHNGGPKARLPKCEERG